MLKSKELRTSKDRSKELRNSTPSSLKISEKMLKAKLRKTSLKLSAISRLKTSVSKMRQSCKKKSSSILSVTKQRWSKPTKYSISNCSQRDLQLKSTVRDNSKNKRRSNFWKRKLTCSKSHSARLCLTSKRKESFWSSKMNRLYETKVKSWETWQKRLAQKTLSSEICALSVRWFSTNVAILNSFSWRRWSKWKKRSDKSLKHRCSRRRAPKLRNSYLW